MLTHNLRHGGILNSQGIDYLERVGGDISFINFTSFLSLQYNSLAFELEGAAVLEILNRLSPLHSDKPAESLSLCLLLLHLHILATHVWF